MALSNTKIAIIEYDFAVDGGAIGTITPASNEHIPTGAVVLNMVGAVETTSVGAGATCSLKVGALVLSNAPAFNIVAPRNIVWTNGPGTTVAAGGEVVLTIGTAPISAGKVKIIIEYAY